MKGSCVLFPKYKIERETLFLLGVETITANKRTKIREIYSRSKLTLFC